MLNALLLKRLDLNRAYSILAQVDSLSVRKEISKAARNVSEQLRRIFILDPIPSHMRNYKPLSEKLQADAANIAGILAALTGQEKKRSGKNAYKLSIDQDVA